MNKIRKGDRVRDAKWGGKFTGTVVRTAGQEVFVQWDNLAVEDEMHEAEVTALGTRVEGDMLPFVKAVKLGQRS